MDDASSNQIKNDSPPDDETFDDSDLDLPPTEAEKQARLEYLKQIAPPHKPKKKWPFVVVALLLVVVGAIVYVVLSHTGSTKKAPHTATITQAKVAPSPKATSTSTVHYVSNGQDLNLNFDYPNTWSVDPPSGDNNSDQTILLNSPLTTIVGSDGKSVTGKVTVMIRPASAGLTELSNGQATAGQASVQIAYTKPTAGQFQYPYLDFIHFIAGNNPASAFEEVLISGSTHFDKGQSITATSVSPDPIITASFYICGTSACSEKGATRLSITNDTWVNGAVFQQTLAIFQSLQIN